MPYGTQDFSEGEMGVHILVGAVFLTMAQPSQTAETAPLSPEALTCPLDRPYAEINPFARILRGELPSSRVYEDEEVVVIMPLEWEHPGHALVIPKVPVRSLLDMTQTQMGHALDVARRTGVAQQRALGATGFTITQNNGRNQDVCHVHFHVVPNTPSVADKSLSREELDRMAGRLRAVFPEE
ncbi:MAG: HIT domain-containing protein [Alphaproteobacteria bacterium]|nr:MAG: HIT domain-containing protein [Alphaproteobacteria bacterium]